MLARECHLFVGMSGICGEYKGPAQAMKLEGQSGPGESAPIASNEVVSARLTAPPSVVRITGGRYLDIRVRVPVHNKERTKPQHAPPDDLTYEETLARWRYWRLQMPEENKLNSNPRWQFLTPDVRINGQHRPYLFVLERHEDEALELVTAHWRRPEWLTGWRERNREGNAVNERREDE